MPILLPIVKTARMIMGDHDYVIFILRIVFIIDGPTSISAEMDDAYRTLPRDLLQCHRLRNILH